MARERPNFQQPSISGRTPNPSGFLDFPLRTPYTGRVFKLSVCLTEWGGCAIRRAADRVGLVTPGMSRGCR